VKPLHDVNELWIARERLTRCDVMTPDSSLQRPLPTSIQLHAFSCNVPTKQDTGDVTQPWADLECTTGYNTGSVCPLHDEKRSTEMYEWQAYGVMFTDLTIRGVHIEALFGYDTSNFLTAFSSLCKWPKEI